MRNYYLLSEAHQSTNPCNVSPDSVISTAETATSIEAQAAIRDERDDFAASSAAAADRTEAAAAVAFAVSEASSGVG